MAMGGVAAMAAAMVGGGGWRWRRRFAPAMAPVRMASVTMIGLDEQSTPMVMKRR